MSRSSQGCGASKSSRLRKESVHSERDCSRLKPGKEFKRQVATQRALRKVRGCKQEEKTVVIPKALWNENPREERHLPRKGGSMASHCKKKKERCGLIQYGNEEVTGVIKAEARLQGVRE